jgi:hypothetical protein
LKNDATYNLPFVKNGLGRMPLAIALIRTAFIEDTNVETVKQDTSAA